jgi:hypothetical protein
MAHGHIFLHFLRNIPNVYSSYSSPQSLLGHQPRRNWVPCLSSSLSKGSPQLSALPLGLVYNPQSSTGQIVRRNSGIYGIYGEIIASSLCGWIARTQFLVWTSQGHVRSWNAHKWSHIYNKYIFLLSGPLDDIWVEEWLQHWWIARIARLPCTTAVSTK